MQKALIVCPPTAGNGAEETPERKTGLTCSDFLRLLFSPLDHVVVMTLARKSGAVETSFLTAERAASDKMQAWLRFKNVNGSDVFVCLNTFKPDAQRRTKGNLQDVRHCWLDLDTEGVANLSRLRASSLVPEPTFVLSTSPLKFQVIWRVEGATVAECESLNRALAFEFGGDAQSCDAVHVLRVPQFCNKKYPGRVWVTGEQLSEETYSLGDFHLPLPQPRPQPRKASSFIHTAAAPSRWDTRPEIDMDDCLKAAGYELVRGGKAKCPVCGHRSVNIDYQKRVYFCFGCQQGDSIGALARRQGRRLAL